MNEKLITVIKRHFDCFLIPMPDILRADDNPDEDGHG